MVEAQRVHQRTRFDLEMIKSMGYCHGIENYSRHFSGRLPGEPPPTLLDYFPRDFLLFVDESHATIPQVHGMWHGDRSRKQNLVDYGFRLPSAMDNRPLKFEEFENRVHQTIYVSATPGPYELTRSAGVVVEQVIRPTGLVDPEVEIRPVKGQIDDLLAEIRDRAKRNERVLVTTLTKRMAEDLAGYYTEVGVRCRYMHSEIETLERVKLLAGPAQGRIRCAHRHQPAARRSRPAGGFAGRDSRCRQGRLSALRRFADPDHGPRRAPPRRPGHSLRRQDDRLDAQGHRRNRSPPRHPARLQRGARHHAAVDHQPGGHGAGADSQGRVRRRLRWKRRPGMPEFTSQADVDAYIAKLETEMREAAQKFEFEKAAKLRDTHQGTAGEGVPVRVIGFFPALTELGQGTRRLSRESKNALDLFKRGGDLP